MADRATALEGRQTQGDSGLIGDAGPGVFLSEIRGLTLWQVSAWPETAAEVERMLARALGVEPPAFGRVAVGGDGALIRIEPLKWQVMGAKPALDLPTEKGALLDLSHARTVIRIAGRDAAALLSRLVPVDLRDASFPDGAYAATLAHHTGVSVIRRDEQGKAAYDLYVTRTFGLEIWKLLRDHAQQFGLRVTG